MTDEDLAVIRRFAKALPEQAYGARLLRVLSELERRGIAIARVQDLHMATEPGEWICESCAEEWPCPTIRALDGESS